MPSKEKSIDVRTKQKPESLTHKILRYARYPRYFGYAVGIFFVLLLLTNTTFPILNPESPPPIPFDWIVTYPPSPPNSLRIPNGSSMIFLVKASAPQAFADSMEVIVHARGSENADFVDTVRDVTLGFYGAYWYPVTPNGFQVSPCSGIILTPNGTEDSGQVWFVPYDPTNPKYMHLAGDDRSISF